MKTKEELHQKVRLTPRLPRVLLKANSQSGQQDQRDQNARSSWDPPSESKSYRETWNNAVDYRIPGILLSTVVQEDTNRQNKVKKLIKKFESHQHKESFLQDLSQTQKINKFSKESQDLIADMNNTEIFELCENSSKKQCPDAIRAGKWALSIAVVEEIFNLRKDQRFEKNNCDVSSIPGCVIKKNSSRGVKHGPSERQRMYYKAKEMQQKSSSRKSTEAIHPYLHDGTTTTSTEIRCHSLGGPRRISCYLTQLPWRIIHTSRQKLREFENSTHRILTLNQEGAQQPLHQRTDFAQAKRECKRLHEEHMAKTQQDCRTIPRSQQIRQRQGQAFEGIEEYDYAVDARTGWRFFQVSRGEMPTASSSSTN